MFVVFAYWLVVVCLVEFGSLFIVFDSCVELAWLVVVFDLSNVSNLVEFVWLVDSSNVVILVIVFVESVVLVVGDSSNVISFDSSNVVSSVVLVRLSVADSSNVFVCRLLVTWLDVLDVLVVVCV